MLLYRLESQTLFIASGQCHKSVWMFNPDLPSHSQSDVKESHCRAQTVVQLDNKKGLLSKRNKQKENVEFRS